MALTPEEEAELRQLEAEFGGGTGAPSDMPVASPGAGGYPVDFGARQDMFFPEATATSIDESIRGAANEAGISPFLLTQDSRDEFAQDSLEVLGPMAAGMSASSLFRIIPAVSRGLSSGNLATRMGMGVADAYVGDTAAKLPGEVMDAARTGNISRSMGDAFIPGLTDIPSLALGAGSTVLDEGFGWLANRYDKDKELNAALSMSFRDFDANKPLAFDDALGKLKGQGIFDDPSILKEKEPFQEILKRFEAADILSKQDLDGQLRSLPDIELSKLDPERVLANGEITTGANAKTRASIASTEKGNLDEIALKGSGDYDEFGRLKKANERPFKEGVFDTHPNAKMVLNADEFNEYSAIKKQAKALDERRRGYAIQEKGSWSPQDEDRLNVMLDVVDDYEIKITNNAMDRIKAIEEQAQAGKITAVEANNLKAQYAKEAYTAEGIKDSNRAGAYEDLRANTRNVLGKTAQEVGMAESFERSMEQAEALRVVDSGINARAAQSKLPSGADESNLASVDITSSGRPRVRWSDRIFGGDTAEDKLRRSMGQTLSQRAGDAGQAFFDKATPGRMAAGTQSIVEQLKPQTSFDGSPKSMNQSLAFQTTYPKMPGALPRNLDGLDPAIIEQLIPAFSPPEVAQDRIFQWKRAVASGDKATIAQFLSAMSVSSPDFPLERGAITGMSSEFEIGDGKARLYNDMDKMMWQGRIRNSSLSEYEKAQREHALNKEGIVYPMDISIDATSAVNENNAATSKYRMAPRVATPMGNRRIDDNG